MKCPKCGYKRTFGETVPEWQCPSCGIAYAKAGSSADARGAARTDSPGSGGKFVMLLVAIAAVAAWALVPGLRQGTKPPDQADIANAKVVMYSLTTCGYCNAKRAELKAAGIPFVEHFVDTDQERFAELTTKLQNAGYRGGGVGTPTFDVNGKMLLNNPSLETIIKHL